MEVRLRVGEFLDSLSVNFVSDTHRNLIPCAQDVQLGKEEVSQSVHARCVTCDDCVVPTTATIAACGRATFATNFTKLVTIMVKQFSWERTRTHTRGVSLDDSDGARNASGANT